MCNIKSILLVYSAKKSRLSKKTEETIDVLMVRLLKATINE